MREFIRTAFATAYGARMDALMPELYTLERATELMAACGLRHAASERLFLERYLDAPVEEMLPRDGDGPATRTGVIEVGNLSIARPGVSRDFIAHLTQHLYVEGMTWAVFTAVRVLRNNFRRLGIPLHELAPADPLRLPPGERAAWGSYYAAGAVVCAVKVADAHARLERSA